MCVATVTITSQLSSYMDFLIIFAGLFIAYANYSRDNYINYKLAVMGSQTLWVMHTLHFNDYPMLACASIILLTTSYSLLVNMYKDGILASAFMRIFNYKLSPVYIPKTQPIAKRINLRD